jgi:uncharacterized membrane protein YvlD (DUF360 family)
VRKSAAFRPPRRRRALRERRDRALGSLLIGAAVLGIANAIVKPVLTILTLPLILVTLGVSYFALDGAQAPAPRGED